MTSLLQSVSPNGPFNLGVGSSWGLEDRLLSAQAACMYKVYDNFRSIYLFWGSLARLFKRYVQRPDEITEHLRQLCIDLCFEGMHDSPSQVRRNQLQQHISTKQSFWMDGHSWNLYLDCLLFEPSTSQGQWKPSVCYLRCNPTVTRWPTVIGVDVGLAVGVRMIISVFLTRRDTIRIKAVHWEWGSPNRCMLFQASTCYVIVYTIYSSSLYNINTHTVRTVRPDSCTSFASPGCIDRFHLILCSEPRPKVDAVCWPVVRHELEQ